MKKSNGFKKIDIAVFIFGNGNNLKNLIEVSFKKNSKFKIGLIVSSNKKAKGLKYSKKFKIKKLVVNYQNLKKKDLKI